MPNRCEDPAVSTARREALVVLLIFLVAMTYTITLCSWRGYARTPESLTFIAGFPDWVFWGVVMPWGVCLLLSFWFGHTFMRDSELGSGGESEDDGLEDDHV